MNTISFPGLGIGPFQINRIAFTIPLFGSYRGIAWYGIIITVGIILAVVYVMTHCSRENIKRDDVLDYAIFLIPSAIIGARLYYVIFYGGYDNFLDIISFWKGGLAIYGGIIGGAVSVIIVSLVKKIKPMKMFDLITPALMIGQVIGRWGNFVNAEAYGEETTLPWKMGIQFGGEGATRYYHPTFLYESLWNLLGFIIVSILYKKKKFDGQIFLFYLAWYGFGRMFIEGLRTDSLYWGTIRISQLIGFLSFVAGTILLIILGVRSKNKKKMEESLAEASSLSEAEDVSADDDEAEAEADRTADEPEPEQENSSDKELNTTLQGSPDSADSDRIMQEAVDETVENTETLLVSTETDAAEVDELPSTDASEAADESSVSSEVSNSEEKSDG